MESKSQRKKGRMGGEKGNAEGAGGGTVLNGKVDEKED